MFVLSLHTHWHGLYHFVRLSCVAFRRWRWEEGEWWHEVSLRALCKQLGGPHYEHTLALCATPVAPSMTLTHRQHWPSLWQQGEHSLTSSESPGGGAKSLLPLTWPWHLVWPQRRGFEHRAKDVDETRNRAPGVGCHRIRWPPGQFGRLNSMHSFLSELENTAIWFQPPTAYTLPRTVLLQVHDGDDIVT